MVCIKMCSVNYIRTNKTVIWNCNLFSLLGSIRNLQRGHDTTETLFITINRYIHVIQFSSLPVSFNEKNSTPCIKILILHNGL